MTDRTTGYADAVVAMATSEGALDTVEDELLQIARVVDANSELREHLTDIQVPVGVRLGFVESEVLTAAHPTTRAALALLIAAGRAGDLSSIANEVATRAAEQRDRELAEVVVAVPLDESKRQALKAALERATGKQLEMKVIVDESVVGGVRARIGDIVIDGSLAKRLDDVRTRLAR